MGFRQQELISSSGDPCAPTSLASSARSEDDCRGDIWDVLDQMRVAVDEIRDRLATTHKPFYTIDEFAAVVGRSAYTVRRWVSQGRIAAIRIDGTGPRGRLLVARSELDAVIESGLGGVVPDAAGL